MSTTNNKNSDQEETIDELVGIVMRQTTLSEDDARSKLVYYNNDYVKVIEEFMGTGVNSKKTNSKKSLTINQQIYKEIREVMDNASMNFYSKRESSV